MLTVKAINLEQAKILKMKWARQARVLDLIYSLRDPDDTYHFDTVWKDMYGIEDSDSKISEWKDISK